MKIISLNPASPASQDVPKTSSYITYTKFDVTAGSADVALGTVSVKRTGLGSYKDFDKIWIEDENGNVVAKSKSITSSEEVVLTFSSYVLKAGSTVTLSVVASHDTTNATTSDINTLSVIALSTGGKVTGSFPITGNAMRISAYTTAKALLSNTVSTTTVDVGGKAVNLGEFKIQETETNSAKDLLVKSIRFKQIGSEDTKSLANIELFNDGTKVSTSTVVDGDYVTFLMGTGFVVTDGNTKNFQIKADVIDGQDDRTFIFTLKDTFDVKAVELQTSIGAVVDTASKVNLSTYTLNAGKFNISSDISNPSSTDVSYEQKDLTLLVAKVDVAQDIVSSDKIKVYVNSTKTVENAATTAAIKTELDNNFKNIRLYVNGTLVDSTDTVSYTDGATAASIDAKEFYYEFDSSITLKDNDLIKVVAEVKTSSTATANDAIALDLDTTSFQTVEYTNGDTVATLDKAGTAAGNKFTIKAASITITDNSGYGSSTKFVAGTKEAKIAKFLINAGSAAAIKVKTLKFEITGLTANEYSKLTNLKLKVDGVQVSTTKDATIGSAAAKAYVTFESINLDIAKSGQKTVELYSDLATDLTATAAFVVTLLDNSAGSNITDNNSVSVPNIGTTTFATTNAISGGSLTVTTDGNTPNEAILVANTNDVEVAKFKLEATDDTMEVTDLYLANNYSTTAANTAESAADARFAGLKLYVGSSTTPVDTRALSSGKVHFDLSSDNKIVVAANSSVVITVKADLNAISDDTQTNSRLKLALYSLEALSKATGNTVLAAKVTGLIPVDGTNTESDALLALDTSKLANAMYIKKSAPTLATQSVGTTKLTNGLGKTIYKFTVTADSKADVVVAAVKFNVALGGNTAVANYKLYVSETDKTSDGAFAGTKFTFTDATKDQVVSAGTSKTFELKADVTLVAAAGDSLSVNIEQDTDAADIGTFALANDVLVSNSNFVWSDNSGSPHTRTTSDWSNGYKVKGLNTTSVDLSY